MGFTVKKSDIEDSLKRSDLSLLLPLYNITGGDLSRYLSVHLTPEGTSTDCYSRAEIKLDATYSTVASDTSDLKDVLAFLSKIISLASSNTVPAPGVIINAVKDGVATLEAIIEDENVTGTPVKMTFPITACGTDPVALIATLRIEARGRISNAEKDDEYDPNDPGQAFAKAHMVCNIGNDPREADRTVSGSDAEQANIRQYSISNWALLRGTQTVIAEVTPHCRVTDDVTVWDEIAGLTIYWVQLILETVPPERYRTTFSENFLNYLRREGVSIPDPKTKKEDKKAAKAAKAKDKKAELPAGSRKSTGAVKPSDGDAVKTEIEKPAVKVEPVD
ncbi:hypothetical protein [Roseibium sp.]|uniref:hypothetical protein n=1 Tax=Roseibium sp. TaxID=1936156 RepID=UPI003A96C5C5